MLDLDLRSSKVEKEQEKRRLEAKRKREQELKLQREHEKRERELALLAEQRREQEEAQRVEREQAEAEEARLTGGIKFSHKLIPFLIDEEHEKADDKVILPEDCLTELSAQDVFGRNVVIFRLSAALTPEEGVENQSAIKSIVTTHCGVREFSAPPGHIGLPRKVFDCLGGNLGRIEGSVVDIKYVLLPKCKGVKLRPLRNRFFEVLAVKRCLEENLMFHTALSLGDTITVWFRGTAHPLRVCELHPDAAVSLVDTDVEVDLDTSEELQQKQTELSSSVPLKESSGGVAESAISATSTTYTLGRMVKAPSASSSPASIDITALLEAHVLEPEPSATSSDSILQAKVRLPHNAVLVRRFDTRGSLLQIFLAVLQSLSISDPTASTEDLARRLQLSTRFPPRSFSLSDQEVVAQSLQSLGLAQKSETFIASLLP